MLMGRHVRAEGKPRTVVSGGGSLEETKLKRLKRSDPRKIAIARLIRQRTSIPNQWIARELGLGHVSSVSRYCLNSRGQTKMEQELASLFNE